MPKRDIVVVGASAGGIEALGTVLGGLAPDYDGVIFVVLHIPARGGRALTSILARASPIPVSTAIDREPMRGGNVYVCVADQHLLVGNGHVHVRHGPKENGHRPAVDPLFRSAARYYGPRVVGVILSGTLSDGTAGLHMVRSHGGVAVVQDPSDSLHDGMPTRALRDVGAEHVVPAADIGPLLSSLSHEEAELRVTAPSETMQEEVARLEGGTSSAAERPGCRSQWPCPDCDSVLRGVDDGEPLRFRCLVGHTWSAESLLYQQRDAVEAALWVALRSLEDRVALAEAMAREAETSGKPMSASRFRSDLEMMVESIDILRRLVEPDAFDRSTREEKHG
jgi:two-component system, chemotaxis family, protein-glutamate methylesterase/glutaminase